MAITLIGDPTNLQGSSPTLQGGSPILQPAASIYGPPAPSPQPAIIAAPAAPRISAPTAQPTQSVQVAQPDQAINSIFSPFIGSRSSASNPGVLEYYNKQTGQGFSNPNELYAYASTLGAGQISSFDQLHAPVNQSPSPGYPTTAAATPPPAGSPGQNLATSAGGANLSPADLISLIQNSTQLTPDQISQIQSALGIPAASEAAFAQPSQTTVDFYNQAYTNAGLPDLQTKISTLNDQINQINAEFTAATAKVNENPFLDEASRVGRMSVLQDKAQSTIGNLVNEQQQLQQLYQNGVTQVNNLVSAHTQDFQTQTSQNQARLSYLLNLAATQGQATIAQNQQQVYRYLPQYLQSKAQAIPPETVTSPITGQVFKYNPTTGQFDMVSSGSGQYTVNPLTGQPFSQVTGAGLGSTTPGGTGGGFPSGALTPGSAAAVNNPLGIKPGGQFTQYPTAQAGFQAGVQLVQSYQNGTGPRSINGSSTLDQMIKTWITGDPNSTRATGYNAANVANYLQGLGVQGVSQYTPISQIDPTQLATAIAHFETRYNLAVSSSSGQSSLLSGYVRQTGTGQSYVDLTNVPSNLQAAVTTQANAAGIPALNTELVSKLNAIQDTKTNLAKIQDTVASFLPATALQRDTTGAVSNIISQFLQTNPQISAFNSWRTAVINSVQALAGGTGSGLRINQAEIDAAMQNDLPTITDTLPTAQSKIANLTTQLNNWQNLIFQSNTPGGLQMPIGSPGSVDLSQLNFSF